MWLIDLEAPPQRLRGLLARWGVEVRAGLYVGSASSKTRDALWDLVVEELGATGSAVMVFDAKTHQGFEFRTWGPNRRELIDVDGLSLVRFRPPPRTPVTGAQAVGGPASQALEPDSEDPDAAADADLANPDATSD